jgi:hypothetical protein
MADKVSHSIPPCHEYRFELDQTEAIAIQVRPPLSSSSLKLQLTGSLLQLTRSCPSLPFRQLMQGQAEIFGAEMAPKRWYHFVAECKAAVFSWEGATIEMSTFSPFEPRISNVSYAMQHARAKVPPSHPVLPFASWSERA